VSRWISILSDGSPTTRGRVATTFCDTAYYEVPWGNMFRILSLDGGGIKGVFTASVLASFEADTKLKIIDHFDLIAGTSTGGILAIGLAMGLTAEEPLTFYRENLGDVLIDGHDILGDGVNMPAHLQGVNAIGDRISHRGPVAEDGSKVEQRVRDGSETLVTGGRFSGR
jgi:hypothetical protein